MADEDIPYEAIGEMTVNFARLDLFAHSVAWHLMSDDRAVGQAVTERLMLDAVLDLIRRLLAKDLISPVDDALRAEIKTAVDQAKSLVTRRNRVTHGLWLLDRSQPEAVRMRDYVRAGQLGLVKARADAAEVSAISSEAKDLSATLAVLAYQVMESRG